MYESLPLETNLYQQLEHQNSEHIQGSDTAVTSIVPSTVQPLWFAYPLAKDSKAKTADLYTRMTEKQVNVASSPALFMCLEVSNHGTIRTG